MSATKYQIFLKTVECGSFTKAAEELNFSQSGISHAISSLEEELGVRLVVRSSKGVTFTYEGEQFMIWARRILSTCEAAENAMRDLAGTAEQRLRLGISHVLTNPIVPMIFSTFLREHPKAQIYLNEGSMNKHVEMVTGEMLDLAYNAFPTAPEAEELEIIPMGTMEIHAVLHPDHPLARLDRIPLDVFVLALAGEWLIYENASYYPSSVLGEVVFVALAYLFILAFTARCKAGMVLADLVVLRLLRLLSRGAVWAWRHLRVLVLSLPLTWKTAAVLVALMAAELLMLAYDLNEAELAVYLALHILILGAAMWQVLALRKLQQGGENLAKGDFSHPITLSRGALPELKRHAANLNSVQQGIQQAVEEKMKSERLKTQLITNVSHDIKTPLTSIVNYVDLLKKEEMPSDSAREYLEVLDRQSQRLRKLTEDLVEASKASTGNIPVSLAPTDLNVLLSQVCGEYQQRLEKQVLEPVLSLCEPGAAAMADGRLLWRVLDNLMSNICKYAMPGTRVYLSTEAGEDGVRMVVKNISRYPLNISADELTERFVRGDSSRSTEGSGLGLSIATSLMSLQGGDFRLTIDGDLFKVTLTLPAAGAEE